MAQFTAHPATASDLDYSSKKWSAAIANKDTAISRVFDDVDFSYPAVKRTGVTTTSTPSNKRDAKETGSSAGLVAGKRGLTSVPGMSLRDLTDNLVWLTRSSRLHAEGNRFVITNSVRIECHLESLVLCRVT